MSYFVWDCTFKEGYVLLYDIKNKTQYFVEDGSLIKGPTVVRHKQDLGPFWKEISKEEFLRCVVGGPSYIEEMYGRIDKPHSVPGVS